MKNINLKIIISISILLTFAIPARSQAARPLVLPFDILEYNEVFALRSFDYEGCNSQQRKLIIVDKKQPDFFVTFDGGARMGGVYEGSGCFGLSGYAAREHVYDEDQPSGLSDTITITFSKPLTLKSLRMQLKTPANFRITLNDRIQKDYYAAPRRFWENVYPFRELNFNYDLGFSSNEIKNVTKLTIKSMDAQDWAFAVDYVRFGDVGGNGNDSQPPQHSKNPVVFVPGIGASELFKANDNYKWLPKFLFSAGSSISSLNLKNDTGEIYAKDVLGSNPTQGYFCRTSTSCLHTNTSYTSILKFLRGELINGEFSGGVAGKSYLQYDEPDKRTYAGCDMSQFKDDPNENPNFFVFPYDWRKSNISNTTALKDYINCVKRFHPDKKVDIIAHSMGGLLARRYITEHPFDNEVEKLITIATPWLGAPKFIHVLETGSFFANSFGSSLSDCINNDPINIRGECIGTYSLNMILANNLRTSIESFAGGHELAPSRRYFELSSDMAPLAVKNYPWSSTQDYDFEATKSWLNSRHYSKPGDVGDLFHQEFQDNWRADATGVRYYEFYGQQQNNLTVGQVKATAATLCINTVPAGSINCQGTSYYQPIPTNGDGTVPLISSRRVKGGRNFNSPEATRYFADGQTSLDNTYTEHTKLTENSNV